MSRNRSNDVRGPTSALTSFLRERGITRTGLPTDNPYGRRAQPDNDETENADVTMEQAANSAAALPDVAEEEADVDVQVTESTTVVVEQDVDHELYEQVTTTTRKRKRASSSKKKKKPDSDDEYDEPEASTSRPPTLKKLGSLIHCVNCRARFTVSKYTAEGPNGGLLCHKCSAIDPTNLKPVSLVARKKPIKRKSKKDLVDDTDRGSSRIPRLADTCIRLIAKYIDDVDALGNIGKVNMDKICRIISMNRKLTTDTSRLFLDVADDELSLYDCVGISEAGLKNVAQFCPRLKSLKLIKAAALSDDVLAFYGQHLKDLKYLHVSGAFLVTRQGWKNFFTAMGSRLEQFHIEHTQRFDFDCVNVLVDNCPHLTRLGLKYIQNINDDSIRLLTALKQMTDLEISFPGKHLSDSSVVPLIQELGPGLERLVLDGNIDVSDSLIMDAVLPSCVRLRELSLAQMDLLSPSALHSLFTGWKQERTNKGLTKLSLCRVGMVKGNLLDGTEFYSMDSTLDAIMLHSGHTLTELNLNSVKGLSPRAFVALARDTLGFVDHDDEEMPPVQEEAAPEPKEEDEPVAPNCLKTVDLLSSLPNGCGGMLRELDISWIRCVDDNILQHISKSCSSLETIKVYGNHHVTECVSSVKVNKGNGGPIAGSSASTSKETSPIPAGWEPEQRERVRIIGCEMEVF